MNRLLILICLLMIMPLCLAKEAESLADNPVLEKHVNDLTSELRCLVCQNQTIADSHAELAIDLKNQVRTMVKDGRSDDEIKDYMVQRYGDFVLYRPPVKTVTLLLWAGPFLLLVIGLVFLVITLRKRNAVLADDAPISEEQQQRIRAALQTGTGNEGGEKQT